MRHRLITAATVVAALAAQGLPQPSRAEDPAGAVNLSASAGFSMSPRLVSLPGGVAATWREGNVFDAQVFLAATQDAGVSYSPGRNISGTTGPTYLPALARGPLGEIHAVWREPLFGDGLIRYSRADSVDAAFTPAADLSSTPPAFQADIAAGPGGRLLCAWDQGFRVTTRWSADGGAQWSAPRTLSPANANASDVRAVFHGTDNKVALFYALVPVARSQVMLRRSTDGGVRFGKPVQISRGYGDVAELEVAADGGRRLFAAMCQLRGDTQATPNRILLWRENGKARALANGRTPSIAVGPDRRVHLVWRDRSAEIAYAVSTDNGKHFSTPVNISQTPGGAGGFHDPGFSSAPSVAVGGDGGVYIAWQEAVTADNDEVFVRRLP